MENDNAVGDWLLYLCIVFVTRLNWIVTAKDTNTFKSRLDTFWHNQEVTYGFCAQLQGTRSRSVTLCVII